MTAIPAAAMRRSNVPTRSVSARDRPAVGSSSISTRGRVANARAISTRRLSTWGSAPAGRWTAPS